MGDDGGTGGVKGKVERRFRGFRRAGGLIAAQTRAAESKRGYADARLKALWEGVVGSEIAAVARPVRLAPSRGPAGGLLTLGVLGANGPQVQMLAPLIRERVNGALGPGTVGRIQITQGGRGLEPVATARPERPTASVDLEALAAPLSSIGDPELRAALETLARNVISQARSAAAKEI